MSSGWMKSLRCRSNDVDDVVCLPAPSSSSSAKKWPLLPSLLLSCADSSSRAPNDVLPKRPSAASSRTRKPKPRPRPQVSAPPPSP
ncbi:Zinc finger protein, partial [Musa troglodytarum]